MGEAAEEMAKRLDFRGTTAALIISAFGFVAALFWRDAIQALLDRIVPARDTLALQFLTAVIVTFIAVLAIYIVTRYAEPKKTGEATGAKAKDRKAK